MKSQLVCCDAYATSRCLLINCQAQAASAFVLEDIVLLYLRFYIQKRGKLVRFTVSIVNIRPHFYSFLIQ